MWIGGEKPEVYDGDFVVPLSITRFLMPFNLLYYYWPARYPDDDDEDDLEMGLGQTNGQQLSLCGKRKSLVSLLPYFASPGVRPPFSRVDPALDQRVRKPIRLLDLWKYGYFAASKGVEISLDIVSHYVRGPRRPSWGIEMTIISSIMRNSNRHAHLADLATIRATFQLAGFVPLPGNAMATPVSFRVRRRGLRGLLADFDAAENGHRELSGEWVVGKQLWQNLQAEWKASHSRKHGRSLPTVATGSTQRVVLYLHGGAYYVSSAATHRVITIPLAKYVGARVFSLDYRLAPETRFPGPLHDAVSAYFRLVDDLSIPPKNILLAGDSAGGGLSLALLMYLRDNDYPLPAGAILMSPWVDLTMSCDSWDSNSSFDIISQPNPGDHLNPIACYLGKEGLERYLTHPYASPLFGDFTGLPPMLIQCGDAEVLRDEITLLAHKATLHGVDVQHEIFQDAVHVFQMFPFLENTRKSFISCRQFVRSTIVRHETRPLRHLRSQQLAYETSNANSRIVRDDGAELPTAQPAGDELAYSSSSSSPRSEYNKDIDRATESGGGLDWKKRGPLLPAALQRRDQNLVLSATRDSIVPTPMTRTESHPDMAQLCQDWAQGHANQTTTYIWSTSNLQLNECV